MASEERHSFRELNALSTTLDFGRYSSEVLYWGYIGPEYWRNYRHIHSFFEVCYALQGAGQFRIYGKTIDVAAGDIFFARPNEPHDIISTEDDPLEIYFWAFTLIPAAGNSQTNVHASTCADPQDERVQLRTHDGRDSTRTLFDQFVTSSVRCCSASLSLEQTLHLLLAEISAKRTGYQVAIEGLAANLLIETGRLGCDSTTEVAPVWPADVHPLGNNGETAVILQIKHYLQDNYMHPIRLKEIAAQVHLSERHVCRIFSQATNHTIQQYLANIRLDVAKQLLLDPTNTVADVATATGFADQRYFSTFFRRNTGETPSSYRQNGGTAFIIRPDEEESV